jgi:hypothetical protein
VEEIAARLDVDVAALKPFLPVIARAKLCCTAALQTVAVKLALEGNVPILKLELKNKVGFSEDPALAKLRQLETRIKEEIYKRQVLAESKASPDYDNMTEEELAVRFKELQDRSLELDRQLAQVDKPAEVPDEKPKC